MAPFIAIVPQLFVNGLIAGALYSLIAVGFSLIYATNRFMHLAHGAVMAIGAFLLYTFFGIMGWNFYLAAILGIIGSAGAGLGCFYLLYRPLRRRGAGNMVMLIASVGLLIFISNVLTLIFGADPQTIDYFPVREGIHFGSAIITPLQIVIVVASVLILLIMWLFLKLTRFGTTIRAVADNPELARISGINTDLVQAVSFIIASAIAGFAAIFIVIERNVEPTMGIGFGLFGFTGAVLGGLSSVPGAIVGTYIIGISENVSQLIIPAGYKDAIAFFLMFLFLLIKPSGLFGVDKGTRQ